MNIFSFRADGIQDVFALMLTPGMRAVHRLTIFPDQIFPDVEVELATDMSEAELLRLINAQPDAHVIADTLRPSSLIANPVQRGEDPDPFPPEPEF